MPPASPGLGEAGRALSASSRARPDPVSGALMESMTWYRSRPSDFAPSDAPASMNGSAAAAGFAGRPERAARLAPSFASDARIEPDRSSRGSAPADSGAASGFRAP